MTACRVVLAVMACTLAPMVATPAAGADVQGADGTVVGVIFAGGGAAPAPVGKPAWLGGVVTVFGDGGQELGRQRVKHGHQFRFVLAPGHYRLVARRKLHATGGCPPTLVTVSAGHATHADVMTGCSVAGQAISS